MAQQEFDYDLPVFRSVMHAENLEVYREGKVFKRFVSREDDRGTTERAVSLTDEHWRELGEPDTITVFIQPGDQLNREENHDVAMIPGDGSYC